MTTITSVKMIRACDRDTGAKLLVNGVEVARVNFDEHGGEGEAVLEQVLNGLARLANVYPATDEVADGDFDAAC